ncbi:MAG TPA: Hsp20/alpha crystallin family protein [Candidatus Udaeobacter sp.]
MDAIFADTFRSVGSWFGQSTYARSIDLREQNDKYIARLYVPKGDTSKVDAKVENGALHITAQNEGTVNGKTERERYEQIIALPKPVQADNVKVEKKDDVVVITIPKATVSAPAVAAVTPMPTATASSASGTDWADTMLWQMNQMQAHLNQSIQDVFHNDLTAGASTSQLGSAMNLEDQPGKYVVHYYLPGRNLSDVNVKFENGQLHLSAQKQEKTSDDTAGGKTQSTTVARYESMTTLPGPVKESEMKVDRKEGSVVVTLPKA